MNGINYNELAVHIVHKHTSTIHLVWGWCNVRCCAAWHSRRARRIVAEVDECEAWKMSFLSARLSFQSSAIWTGGALRFRLFVLIFLSNPIKYLRSTSCQSAPLCDLCLAFRSMQLLQYGIPGNCQNEREEKTQTGY